MKTIHVGKYNSENDNAENNTGKFKSENTTWEINTKQNSTIRSNTHRTIQIAKTH